MATGGFVSKISQVVPMIDPEAWKIVDGKLFLALSKGTIDKWSESPAANMAKADQRWAKIMGQN